MSIDDDEPRDLALEGLIELAHRRLVDGLRTSLPGKITAYDDTTQKASVQVLVQHGEVIAGDRVVAPLSILNDVIVMFPGTSRGRITWPVAVGDTCLVTWASSSLAVWRTQGGGPVDPGDDRRHHIADAVCYVGLHDFGHVPTAAPTDAIVTHGLTKIGGPTGTQKTLRADDFKGILDTFINALATAVGTSGTVPGATASAAAITAAYATFTTAYAGVKSTDAEVK